MMMKASLFFLALALPFVHALTVATMPTLQVVVNPKLLPGEVVRKGAYAAFRELAPDQARFVPWFPYPRLAVFELEAPTDNKTSWNFTLPDPPVLDFLDSTVGRSPVVGFSTIPVWMFKNTSNITIPENPTEVFWDYNGGTELVDSTGKQVGDYYARVASWYSKGGFEDELGVRHDSGHHYDLPFWEVLNEPDIEHETTPQQYNIRYDAIVQAVSAVSPNTEFVGLALAHPTDALSTFLPYFLNASNHAVGIPIDWISYHFYASPVNGTGIDDWQNTFFSQADTFLRNVSLIEDIRNKLSPHTRTMMNEVGVILPTDNNDNDYVIPDQYWNAAGAMYAYLYIGVTRLGLNGTVGESQLVGYPTQYPSVSMVNWTDGSPNARFRVLQLLKTNIGPGDEVLDDADSPVGDLPEQVVALPFVRAGETCTKVLLVNHLLADTTVTVNGAKGGKLHVVDLVSGPGPIRTEHSRSDTVPLGGFSVTVVDLPA